jgi:hypothetical protein
LTSPQPSVGRIVHYVSYGTPVREDGSQAYTAQCRAAIIAGVPHIFPNLGAADLAVLNPDGMFFKRCNQDESGHEGGSWHWPERV